ncbi:MAG: hypothetical protein K2J81_04915 [Treponemataceae bacterium]|nr:hypothetical protein [Treponemataceae bacterium]
MNIFLLLPEWVFLCPIGILRPAFCRCLFGRIFLERQNAVVCPGAIFSNGKLPLLARTFFLQTAECRCLSLRVFFKRQNAVACSGVFSSNGKTPLPVQAGF